MTVLVTGASGFLGAALCRQLREMGVVVRAYHRPGGGTAEVDRLVPLADPMDPAALAAGLDGCDAIFHLAARVHQVQDAAADPLTAYRQVNVDWTRVLLRAARAAKVPKFVFASSVKAVGEASDTPWTRATVPAPVDPYGISKREAEQLLLEPGPMATAILRFPLIYGPGVRANMRRLFRAAQRGIPIPVAGDARRSLLFLGNAVDALCAATAITSTGPWFVSDGPPVSTAELVGMIADALGRPARVLRLPTGLLRLAGRLGDGVARVLPFPLTTATVQRLTSSLVVDEREFIAAASWTPRWTTAEGLSATARWFSSAGEGSA